MKGTKLVFVCRECGATSPKWIGKCPDCKSWNSYDEIEIKEKTRSSSNNLNLDPLNKV